MDGHARLTNCLRDVRSTGTACFYYINELRYAVQAGYVELLDGMLWKDGQRAELTDSGKNWLELAA